MLEQLRQLKLTEDQQEEVEHEITSLDSRRQELDRVSATVEHDAKARADSVQVVTVSFQELRQRQEKLTRELKDLEKQPSLKQMLRYRTPVSHPVQNEELLFECAAGRVTFLDIATLLAEMKDSLEEKGKLLHNMWEVSDVTRPAGAFRLRYTIERQRDTLDTAFGAATPSAHGQFSYGLSEWVAEPLVPVRGENASAALAKGSQFRLLVDALDPQQSVVTFWVYPDSFALYRQLRDYLYEHDITVAGRPLPEGMPISCCAAWLSARGDSSTHTSPSASAGTAASRRRRFGLVY